MEVLNDRKRILGVENRGLITVLKFIRHGDLLLKRVSDIPKTNKLEGKTLAEGETTGHKHTLQGLVQLYGEKDVQFVEVKQDTILTHQEHKTVQVPEGVYELIHEREYNPFDEQVRRVVD